MNEERSSLVIFLGPPGSGKGTLSQQCVQRLGWVQVSTGNLCRKAIAADTAVGREIAAAVNVGRFVSDELVWVLVQESLNHQFQAGKTVILDGYPRVRSQALVLKDFLCSLKVPIDVFIVRFIVAPDVVIQRIQHRLVCCNSECQAVYSVNDLESIRDGRRRCNLCNEELVRRSDDTSEVAQGRLAAYSRCENEILDFYQNHDQFQVLELVAHGSINDIFRCFCAMMKVDVL